MLSSGVVFLTSLYDYSPVGSNKNGVVRYPRLIGCNKLISEQAQQSAWDILGFQRKSEVPRNALR